MSYKTIQVYLDDGAHAKGRLDLALQLTGKMDSHLVGMHVIPPISYPSYMSAEIPAEIIERRHDQLREVAEKVHKNFVAVCERAGVSYEWRCFEAFRGDLPSTVAEIARYADLNIISQTDPEGDGQERFDLAEPLLFGGGRPVLNIPYAGKFDKVGEKVMVAWSATAESARALFDAMPLLQAAGSVVVMTINPKDTAEANDPLPGADIANVLARHGVKAEVRRTVGEDISVGDMLLSAVSDEGVDMLVMGGYGHSRMRELVFGGATRHILQHMTVPVFMSH